MTIMRPAIRDVVVSIGILFFLVRCAAAAPAPTLEKGDIFAPYAKGAPKVTTVISEETKDGVKVTKLRFASAEGSKEGEVKDCEIYAIIARPANTAGQKLPGMLVCHGGGGMAGEGGPIAWAKLGYVAIEYLTPKFPEVSKALLHHCYESGRCRAMVNCQTNEFEVLNMRFGVSLPSLRDGNPEWDVDPVVSLR
jgi:hypothetical protein